MVKENNIVRKKRFEMVPPDGGWGYMICVAAVINYLAISMFAGSFGMIFKDFMIEHHMQSTTVTFLNGMNVMLASVAGYLTGPLITVMSTRNAALIASLLFNAGVFCTVFINTTALLFACQGIQSFGMGVLYSISCTLINDYFLKKRLLAISITQTCSAAAAMIAPMIVKGSLESFGYKGTLIMISAISLQTFVAVALMQPVSWHMVRLELEGTVDEMKLLVSEKSATDLPVTTPIITVTDTDLPFHVKAIESQGKQTGSKTIIGQILDMGLLKKFLLSNASMGPTYCMFSEILFMLMLPQALYSWNFTKDEVARAIALGSFGDLITRMLFVFTSKWISKFGSQEVFLASVLLAFISRLLMLWSDNTTVMMVFITIIGISRCSMMVMPPLILAESFGSENFTQVLGIFMMLTGIMNLVLGPAVGAIRDHTNSYSTAFYVTTSCYAVIVLLWTIELIYKKNKHKRTSQREADEKLKKSCK